VTDDLFTPLTPATANGGSTRKCRRHEWASLLPPFDSALVVCARCGAPRDLARARRGKSSRRLGADQERRAERVYGFAKRGEMGDIVDLQGVTKKVQQKSTRREPPARWVGIFAALDAINDGRTPAILLSYVRQGRPTEDYFVIRGKDWLDLFGRDE
jgi:hypothetical protein